MEEEGCIIDNLLQEIRTGTKLRKTARQSVRRKPQLSEEELKKLKRITSAASATMSPRPDSAEKEFFGDGTPSTSAVEVERQKDGETVPAQVTHKEMPCLEQPPVEADKVESPPMSSTAAPTNQEEQEEEGEEQQEDEIEANFNVTLESHPTSLATAEAKATAHPVQEPALESTLEPVHETSLETAPAPSLKPAPEPSLEPVILEPVPEPSLEPANGSSPELPPPANHDTAKPVQEFAAGQDVSPPATVTSPQDPQSVKAEAGPGQPEGSDAPPTLNGTQEEESGLANGGGAVGDGVDLKGHSSEVRLQVCQAVERGSVDATSRVSGMLLSRHST